MVFHSLRARLLVLQSALVVGLTVVMLAYVSVRANRAVAERFAGDLARSRDAIATAVQDRYQRLELVGRLMAAFPGLKNLFALSDAGATIRDSLREFRQLYSRDELLVALDGTGRVLARSDIFAAFDIPDAERSWLTPALSGRPVLGELQIDGKTYLCALVPAEAGGTVFGFVLAATAVDDALAKTLKDVSGREIVILSPSGVAASTLPPQRLPWQSSADVESMSADTSPRDVTLAGEHFQAVLAPRREGSNLQIVSLRIVSLQSRDRALAPYRSIQIGLLVLGVVAAGAGIAGSAVVARSLTAPISRLVDATQAVASGDLAVALTVTRDDEIGHLARSFERMTQGLRERADMQKFVSQSTVAMIHNRPPAQQRAGERRALTLLFCDIRGFTNFAEACPPEEAVRVLNRYLHLQADLVKRFHGDVDKFMGDAVFAHFSGPDMALDAIRCAVEIQRAVEAASRTDPGLPALAVGIGIATGEVIIGSIGSDDRLDYTAIGPAVNLSARFCAAAEAQEILMNEQTYEMVRGLVAAEAVPPLVVKGFSAPVRAYRMAVRPTA